MSEPCRSRVGESKKKKRDTAGHRNPARRTRSGVRHVSDTDTTPKMACPCNLLMVIGTTSEVGFLKSIGFCNNFSVTYNIPTLKTNDAKKVKHFCCVSVLLFLSQKYG